MANTKENLAKTAFKKGYDPRRGHRQKGTRNFATDFNEAVKEIAKLNKITVSEARMILMKKGYAEAKDGNFQFWKYVNDQLYGTAPETIEHKGEIGISQIIINSPNGITNKPNS